MTYSRIKGFVERLAPELVCERCVASRLEIRDSDATTVALQDLAALPEFERQTGPCALCGESTQAIRRKVR